MFWGTALPASAIPRSGSSRIRKTAPRMKKTMRLTIAGR
jgi:hypothetical protein